MQTNMGSGLRTLTKLDLTYTNFYSHNANAFQEYKQIKGKLFNALNEHN